MNVGKTMFAQVMEFVPWKTFGRIIERHKGDAGVRTLGCADLFRVMAFAQLTWRESLRDIEVCLAANRAKLFHMGLKAPPARSTLADALNQRDWRIYHGLAQRLIARARMLYGQDPSILGLDATVYALDATTIDLCLSLFDWAPFRSTKAAVKLQLLDLRGSIPAFIHISDGKLHDVNVLDLMPLEAGAFYVMDRGYVDFERLYTMHQAGAFFVTRAKTGMDALRVYSEQTDRTTGVMCDQRIMFNGFYSAKHAYEGIRPSLAAGNECRCGDRPAETRPRHRSTAAFAESQGKAGSRRRCAEASGPEVGSRGRSGHRLYHARRLIA